MSNCNTLTCMLDGKITPVSGTLDGRGASDVSGDCTGRGPGTRSDRKTARQPAPGTTQVVLKREPAPVGQRPTVPSTTQIIPKREPAPVGQRQPVPSTMQIIPKREPAPVGGGDGSVQGFQPKPTDLGGGAADTSGGNAQGSPLGPLTHVEGAVVVARSPKGSEAVVEGMVLEQAQSSATVKASGALSPQLCYTRFLGLPPIEQARIVTVGVLGRYALAQAAARDILNGAPSAAQAVANWIFNVFQPGSVEQATFCNGVATFAPSGSLMFAAPLSRPVSMLAQQAPDLWTSPAALAWRQEHQPPMRFAPAGAIALLDDGAAMQLFGLLSRDRQAAILRGSAFAGLAYPAALAAALERGEVFIDGVPVPDLFDSYMGRFSLDDPRRVLFRLAVQDSQTAPAGYLYRSAGNVSTGPTGGGGGGSSSRTGTAPGTPGANVPSTSGTATATAGAAPATPPANFLQQAGLNATQWATLASEHPDVAVQLWREFNNRPNTFAQVATVVMQGLNAVVAAVHQQNVDDLASTNASYAHQQSMANIALRREETETQRALAASQASQPVVTYQQQVAPPPPPPPPPASGITATHVAVGGVAVAAVAGAIYFFTRKKRNRHPRGARGAKRNVSKAAA